MTTNLSPTVIGERIQKLLTERQQHADALAAINATLVQIGGMLGSKAAVTSTPAAAASPTASSGKKRRRTRRTFAISGDESVLAFVKKTNGATTAEIQKHWQSEGRGGKADNSITKLTKEGKLKRTPLKDQRGSRYTAAR